MEHLSSVSLHAVLISGVAVIGVYWLSSKKNKYIKRILEWVPAILFAYLIPAVITHSMRIDLSQDNIHQISRDFIIPLAILLVMSALSFRQLKVIGVRPVILFVSGSLVIATIPVFLVWSLKFFDPTYNQLFVEQEYWKGLVPIVGGWIGGSTSQLVLKELVNCPDGIFLAVLVLDNILVNIWTILMFQMIKRSDQLNSFFTINDEIPDFVPDEVAYNQGQKWSIIKTIAISLIVLLAGLALVSGFLQQVILFSVIGLFLGNFVSDWNHSLVLKIGGVLIVVIMSILGLKLNFSQFSLPAIVVIVGIIWIIGHYVFMMLVARLLRLHMAWVPIASMANLGGISTAPAVAAAYNEEWMPHAIMLAILSMVTGTAWGMLTIYLFQSL